MMDMISFCDARRIFLQVPIILRSYFGSFLRSKGHLLKLAYCALG